MNKHSLKLFLLSTLFLKKMFCRLANVFIRKCKRTKSRSTLEVTNRFKMRGWHYQKEEQDVPKMTTEELHYAVIELSVYIWMFELQCNLRRQKQSAIQVGVCSCLSHNRNIPFKMQIQVSITDIRQTAKDGGIFRQQKHSDGLTCLSEAEPSLPHSGLMWPWPLPAFPPASRSLLIL